jgi:protein-S-isoprenylcysteine O-methyltransferase Ste14
MHGENAQLGNMHSLEMNHVSASDPTATARVRRLTASSYRVIKHPIYFSLLAMHLIIKLLPP